MPITVREIYTADRSLLLFAAVVTERVMDVREQAARKAQSG